MYAPFFGLSKEPFSIAPDPRFLFMSEQHREALAHLLYGLDGGGGFVLLTGEVGAGKTTVCRCFLEQVPAHCAVAYIFNPKLTATELLQTVCGEFGISPPAQADSVKAHVDALNTFLLAAHAQGRQAVLVIDEAQSLSADVLEQLRLLTNLETAERKLLQIVLIGQPELRDMVARPELEQLGQRIIARYHLGALTLAETQQYIQHRLSVAGPSAPLPFSAAALLRIHALSGGVPRRINLLADRALLGAYAQGQPRAERATVEQAAREVFGRTPPAAWRRHLAMAMPAGVAALVLLCAGLAWALWQRPVVGAGAMAGASAPASAPASASASVRAAAGPADGAASAPSGTAGAAGAAGAAATPPDAVSATGAAATAAAAASAPSLSEPAELLAAAHADIATARRELALRWNVSIGDGDPCAAAAQARLACFRSASGGLAVVRQLARPGVLTLRGPRETPLHAVLVALDERQATLEVGARRFVLSLPTLATLWRGEFNTFWRLPPGWRDGPDGGTDVQARTWLDAQLAAAGIAAQRLASERVWAFQLAQGLPPDGRAGPMTVMRLNRVAGVDEPRLVGGNLHMSYILDALRRSQAERERGQVPGLHAQPVMGRAAAAAGTGGPARWAAPLVALGLVGGAALLAWWWLARPAVAPATVPVTATVPAVLASPAAAAAPALGPTPGQAPAALPAPVPAPGPPPAPAREPARLPMVVSAPPAVPSTSARAASAAAPAPAAAAAPMPAAVPTPSPPAPAVATARALKLAELTPEQRRAMPALALGGSIWSESALARFVIVNGQVVREGEAAAPGVVVESIGQKAVLLRWRDLRVEVPL